MSHGIGSHRRNKEMSHGLGFHYSIISLSSLELWMVNGSMVTAAKRHQNGIRRKDNNRNKGKTRVVLSFGLLIIIPFTTFDGLMICDTSAALHSPLITLHYILGLYTISNKMHSKFQNNTKYGDLVIGVDYNHLFMLMSN